MSLLRKHSVDHQATNARKAGFRFVRAHRSPPTNPKKATEGKKNKNGPVLWFRPPLLKHRHAPEIVVCRTMSQYVASKKCPELESRAIKVGVRLVRLGDFHQETHKALAISR
jgi:hypothetical protein